MFSIMLIPLTHFLCFILLHLNLAYTGVVLFMYSYLPASLKFAGLKNSNIYSFLFLRQLVDVSVSLRRKNNMNRLLPEIQKKKKK